MRNLVESTPNVRVNAEGCSSSMAGLFVLLHSPGDGGPEARLRSAFRTPSVAPASLRIPASLADRPEHPVRAFATVLLTLRQSGSPLPTPRQQMNFQRFAIRELKARNMVSAHRPVVCAFMYAGIAFVLAVIPSISPQPRRHAIFRY